jgi:hypothetical protein
MTAPKFLLAVSAAAFMQPPNGVEARILMIPSCGGGAHHVLVPGDPADPHQRRDCAKACHAITDRRSKASGSRKGCC